MGCLQYRGGPRLLTNMFFLVILLGGDESECYASDHLFHGLKLSEANIVVIEMGGNDLDDISIPCRHLCRQVLSNILWMCRELQRLGKQAYVVHIPTRFSTREKDLDQYRADVKYVNDRLWKLLHNRCICLRRSFFQKGAFEEWKHLLKGKQVTEYVHLTTENYALFASVLDDLTLAKSKPSNISVF